MSRLVTDLLDRWADRPILVIGGGPSVNADLPRLVEVGVKPACVISANAHGAKQQFFPVDVGVNVDKRHNLLHVPMEQHMREGLPGAIIVNKHSWADYRLPDWRFVGNSGLTAIALACVLGGNPVICTGIDFWHGGRQYFHTPAEPEKRKRPEIRGAVVARDRDRIRPLVEFCRGANVRPMSGPLREFFKPFDPAETEFWSTPVTYRTKLLRTECVIAESTRTFIFSNHDVVMPGRQIAVSETELKANPRWGVAIRKVIV